MIEKPDLVQPFEAAVEGNTQPLQDIFAANPILPTKIVDFILGSSVHGHLGDIFKQAAEQYSNNSDIDYSTYVSLAIEQGSLDILRYVVETHHVSLNKENHIGDLLLKAIYFHNEQRAHKGNVPVFSYVIGKQDCLNQTITKKKLFPQDCPHDETLLSYYAYHAATARNIYILNFVLQNKNNQQLFFTPENLIENVVIDKFGIWLNRHLSQALEFTENLRAYSPTLYKNFFNQLSQEKTSNYLHGTIQASLDTFFERFHLEQSIQNKPEQVATVSYKI